MTRHIVLLRGINLGPNNRISMAELRSALEADGFRSVATYLQSGNAIVSSDASTAAVSVRIHAVIKKRFGLDIAVVVRSRDELAGVVRRNPLAQVVTDPRRYLVTFLSGELPTRVVEDMRSVATGEQFVIHGREVYSWHPQGLARAPLWERMRAKSESARVTATSRNWATVESLLAMADSNAGR